MKTTKILAILALAFGLMVCLPGVIGAAQLGTAFTYQGRLIDANDAADGLYDFQFKLFDDPNIIIGKQIGSAIDVNDMDVIDGYFTAELDFGSDPNILNGQARWLEISVRPGDSNDPNVYTNMSPRQKLTPTLYALALPALRVIQHWESPGIIGGFKDNTIQGDAVGATICGGGKGGSTNRVTDDFGTIGGGLNNQAGNGPASSDDARYSTVGGGASNTASHYYSVIAGGGGNVADSWYATVGGGQQNVAGGNSWATVSGGILNRAENAAATVAGGWNNQATGESATVPGGRLNAAKGDYSFAAGRRAIAGHHGTFVWADSTDANFISTANNQFLIRAGGGVGIGTASPTGTLTVGDGGDLRINSAGDDKYLQMSHDDTDARIAASSGHVYVVPPVSKSLYIRPVQPGTNYGDPQTAIDAHVQHGGDGYGTIKAVNAKASTNAWSGSNDANLYGVYAHAENVRAGGSGTFTSCGVYGEGTATANGTTTTYGIYGTASGGDTNWAGYFDGGDVYIKNDVGIGTTGPQAKLHVDGSIRVSGDLNKEFTVGTSNRATPIAYAFINSNGTVASGTPNVSCTWNAGSQDYEITIAGESYQWTDYITVVTVASVNPHFETSGSRLGKLVVKIWDSSSTATQEEFQFVTYKP